MMNLDTYNEHSMINRKRLRITFPNALQVSEHDSMASLRNWLDHSKISFERACFSIWDEDGLYKYMDDVNISSISAMCDSINRAWHEYDVNKSEGVH